MRGRRRQAQLRRRQGRWAAKQSTAPRPPALRRRTAAGSGVFSARGRRGARSTAPVRPARAARPHPGRSQQSRAGPQAFPAASRRWRRRAGPSAGARRRPPDCGPGAAASAHPEAPQSAPPARRSGRQVPFRAPAAPSDRRGGGQPAPARYGCAGPADGCARPRPPCRRRSAPWPLPVRRAGRKAVPAARPAGPAAGASDRCGRYICSSGRAASSPARRPTGLPRRW